jgi:hypothetical protein
VALFRRKGDAVCQRLLHQHHAWELVQLALLNRQLLSAIYLPTNAIHFIKKIGRDNNWQHHNIPATSLSSLITAFTMDMLMALQHSAHWCIQHTAGINARAARSSWKKGRYHVPAPWPTIAPPWLMLAVVPPSGIFIYCYICPAKKPV